MIDITYDPSADAVYMKVGRGDVARTEKLADDVILDYDEQGRVLGIEILNARITLAPGEWMKTPLPGTQPTHAAE